MISDHQLTEQAKAGDARAFGQLVERHYDMIYNIAYKWCGHREDAEDITQEVCVKLARYLDSFQGNSTFSTWLYRITLNTIKDNFRRRSTRQNNESSTDIQNSDEDNYTNGIQLSTPASQEDSVMLQQVWKAIGQLPEKQKAAVIMVLSEGLSHKQAAEVLESTESAISWHISDARKKLQHLQKGGA